MICSTLSGKLAIKHPKIGVLVREDGFVFMLKRGGNHCGYGYTKGSLDTDKSSGYLRVKICKRSFRVHRLVAECFIINKDNKDFVDHINRNRADNRVENLRWATRTENSNNSATVLNRNKKITVRCCENRTEYHRQRQYLKRHNLF